MYIKYVSQLPVLLSCYSPDNFTVTCSHSAIGSVVSIDLYLDGTDQWHVDWVEVNTDSETAHFEVNHNFAAHETRQFFRNGLDTREYRHNTRAWGGVCCEWQLLLQCYDAVYCSTV